MLLCGCTSPRDREALVGNYKLTYKDVNIDLQLLKNASYVQRVRNAAKNDTFTGNWTYDPTTGDVALDGRLTVFQLLQGSTDFGTEVHTGVVSLPAERYLTGLYLGSDEGPQYIKSR